MAEHGIQCDRIGGHKKNSHRNRVAGSRTIAFHCYDAVADIEARGDFLIQLDQHVCEALSVRILRVAEFFVDAADAAVLVLDSSGDAFQRVGFHFADADEGVAVECIFRNHQKFAIGGFYALARKEILQRNVVFFQHLFQPGFLCNALRGAKAAGIAAGNILIAIFLQNRDQGIHDFRVGHDGAFAFCGADEVRF